MLRGEDPASVRRDVAAFRKAYLEIKYGFKINREIVDKLFASFYIHRVLPRRYYKITVLKWGSLLLRQKGF